MSASGVALLVLLALAPLVVAVSVPVPWWASRARARAAGVEPSRRGLLSLAARVDTVLLQLDGTVTTGLSVVAVDPVEPEHERNLRWFAGALGHAAQQPVGRAMARLSARGRVSGVREEADTISGLVDRHPVRVGPPEWLGMPSREASTVVTDSGVVLGVQVDDRAIGWITVDREVRSHAASSVARLRACDIEPVLVSEDTAATVSRLAEQTGITRCHDGVADEAREPVVDEQRRALPEGRLLAVAGTGTWGRPDLLLSCEGEPDVLLDDLDVDRVATALVVLRAGARGERRARLVGVLVSGLGLALALALTVAGLLGAGAAGIVAGWSALGCAGVLVGGTRP